MAMIMGINTTRVILRKSIEICQFVKTVHEEQDPEKQTDEQQQKGNSFPSEVLGKQKIVKHSSSFYSSFPVPFSTSVPL